MKHGLTITREHAEWPGTNGYRLVYHSHQNDYLQGSLVFEYIKNVISLIDCGSNFLNLNRNEHKFSAE